MILRKVLIPVCRYTADADFPDCDQQKNAADHAVSRIDYRLEVVGLRSAARPLQPGDEAGVGPGKLGTALFQCQGQYPRQIECAPAAAGIRIVPGIIGGTRSDQFSSLIVPGAL